MKKISVLVATVIVAMGITSCGDSHKKRISEDCRR